MLLIRPFGRWASTVFRLEVITSPITNKRSAAARYINESATNEFYLMKIDDSCLNRLKQVLEEPSKEYLRINVETGGCSGFSYIFDIERNDCIEPDEDLIVERDQYRVIVNKGTLPFIKGSTIQYHESLMKSSFQIVNPIADAKCSCGSSFSIDFSKLNQNQTQKSKDQQK